MTDSGIVLIAGGFMVAFLALLGREERLPRNRWAGIRFPSTMRSDEAWKAAHKASWAYLFVMGASMVVYGVRLLTAKEQSPTWTLLFVVVLVFSSLASIIVARRAAVDAESGPPDISGGST